MFKRLWWVFLVMVPVGAVGGFLLMAVVSYVMPKQYESEAIIELKPIQPLMIDGSVPTHTTSQYSYESEFEKIKSRASLAEVVGRLVFTNSWGVNEETASRILTEIVSIKKIHGTDLIAIRVRHTDREDARDIAAELARICQKNRMINLSREQDHGLAELNKAVGEQEDKVEERRRVLATIDRTGSLLAGADMLRDQDMIDAKRDFETDQALLQSMRLQQIRATVAAEIPSESVVIHEEPQIGNSPVSPNVTMNLIVGAVGGFLLSPLLALPVMALLNRLNPRKEGGSSVHPG